MAGSLAGPPPPPTSGVTLFFGRTRPLAALEQPDPELRSRADTGVAPVCWTLELLGAEVLLGEGGGPRCRRVTRHTRLSFGDGGSYVATAPVALGIKLPATGECARAAFGKPGYACEVKNKGKTPVCS